MLDGGDGDAGGVADHGGEARVADIGGHRRDAVVAAEVGADEDDAAVSGRRSDGQRDRRAAMDADAFDPRRASQRRLNLLGQSHLRRPPVAMARSLARTTVRPPRLAAA